MVMMNGKRKLDKWNVLSRNIVFKQHRKVEKVEFCLPSGKKADFYLKSENDAVCILALTKDKKVIIAKQYRPGPDKILMELPGGVIDHNETAAEAARRELLEETGYSGKLKLVTKCYDCAYSTMNRFCFVATDCEKIREQNLDDTEFAQVELISLKEFRKLLKSGKMTDVEVGYLCLDYLKLL